MKTFRWVIVAVVLAALVAGGYGLYQRLTPSPKQAAGEETAPVGRGNLAVTAAAFGSISLPSKAKLSFPAGGLLTEVGVGVGDQVTQGQLLARLDEGPLRQAVVQAQTALKNAEVALKKARELYSPEDILRQEATVAEAQRALEAARADVSITQTSGDKSEADAQQALDKLLAPYSAEDITTAKDAVAQAQRALGLAQQEVSILRTTGERSVADAREGVTRAKAAVADAERALGLARQEVSMARDSGDKSVADAREAINRAKAAVADAQRGLDLARQDIILVRTTGEKNVADAQRLLDEEVTNARRVLGRYAGWEPTNQEVLDASRGQLALPPDAPRSLEDVYRALLRVRDSREKLDLARLQADKSLQAAQNAVARAEETLRQAQTNLTAVELGVDLAQQQAGKSLQAAQNAVSKAEETLRQAQTNLTAAELGVDLARQQAGKSLQAAQNTVANAEASLRQAQARLASLVPDTPEVDKARRSLELARLQAEKSLQTAQNAVKKAEETLRQAQASLAEMKAGADPDEIAAKELQVSQARLTLEEAEGNLKAARLVAPFAGAVAEVKAEAGDRVAAGAPVVVLVDPTRVEVSATVDEVDVARVKVGQTAVVTLDALPQARLLGQIKSISPVAQIQSGVVSYPVVISIASRDGASQQGITPRQGMTGRGGGTSQSPAASGSTGAQVQPRQGMSASIEIVVEMKQNVLLVPSRAVRSVSGKQVVSVKAALGVEEREVQVGSTDSRNTEIVSGLQEGETVVLPAASSSTSSGQRPLVPGFGPGMMR